MQNPFKTLLSFFNKSENSVLGIDIGSSSIKVIQLRKRGGQAVLETYGELALGPYSNLEIGRATHLTPEKLAEALVDVLRESHTTTRQCGIAIPLPSSLVSVIEMPALDSKQLAQMIPIEARKYIPMPITEVTLDWWIIPKAEMPNGPEPAVGIPGDPNQRVVEKIEVLVVAIHNEAINRYQDILHRTGLDSSFFEIEIFSTMRAVLDQDNLPVMIFDMGAGSTKIYIIERGIVRFSHTINRGSQDISIAISRAMGVTIAEAEGLKRSFGLSLQKDGKDMSPVMTGTLNFIFSEANRVLLNYQRRYNRSLSKVLLTGGGINLKGLVELAQANLQAPVSVANPFAKVEAPAFLEKVLESTGPEFSVALGIALRRLQEVA